MRKITTLLGIALVTGIGTSARAQDYGECTDQCRNYDAIAAQYAAGNCSSGKTPQDCQSQLDLEMGQISRECALIASINQGNSDSNKLALIYTAVAATCAYECYSSLGLSSKICDAGGFAAALYEAKLVSEVQDKLQKDFAIGLGVAGAGTASLLTFSNILTTTTGHLQKESCKAAPIFLALAAAQYGSGVLAKGDARKACDNIKPLASRKPHQTAGGPPPAPELPGAPPAVASKGMLTNGLQAGKTPVDEMSQNFPGQGATQLLATAGDAGDILNHMENRAQIPDRLKELGLPLKDLAARLDSGQTPAQILSGLDGLGPDEKAALAEVDKSTKEGAIHEAGFSSAVASAARPGAGASGKKEGLPKFSFGFGKKDEANGKADTLAFAEPKGASDDDIWHANFKGTLFQLVSSRLGKSKDRVQKLDWVTPLNRALAGHPVGRGGAQ